jgi:hypothetical protein
MNNRSVHDKTPSAVIYAAHAICPSGVIYASRDIYCRLQQKAISYNELRALAQATAKPNYYY